MRIADEAPSDDVVAALPDVEASALSSLVKMEARSLFPYWIVREDSAGRVERKAWVRQWEMRSTNFVEPTVTKMRGGRDLDQEGRVMLSEWCVGMERRQGAERGVELSCRLVRQWPSFHCRTSTEEFISFIRTLPLNHTQATMPRNISSNSRTDLLSPTTAPLPSIKPLGLTPLHGPPRHEHLVIVLGVGPGMGLAIARVFAAQGYAVVIMSRSKERLQGWAKELDQLARARLQQDGETPPPGDEQLSAAVTCDVLSTESVKAALVEALKLFPKRRLGTAIYNASVRKKAPFLEQTEQQVADSLQASVLSAFAFLQGCVREMIRPASGSSDGEGPIGGTILVTGATSATRGREGFAAFSSGKTGLRRLCEVAAREHGSDNVHVAHVVVDGLIDSETARKFLGFDVGKGERFRDGTVVLPEEAAKSYLFLAQQRVEGWTFEMDLRPAREHF